MTRGRIGGVWTRPKELEPLFGRLLMLVEEWELGPRLEELPKPELLEPDERELPKECEELECEEKE